MFTRTPSSRHGLAASLPILLGVVAAARADQTTHPFTGVEHRHMVTTIGGRPQSIHAVIIEMNAPGLGFKLTPQNGAGAQMTDEQTTRSFLTQVGAQIAINTHFFTLDGLPTADLIGLAASDGDAYAPWSSDPLALSAGFNISAVNAPALVVPGAGGGFTVDPAVPLHTTFGVSMTNGANPRIVTAGARSTNSSTFDTTPNPRTATALIPGNRMAFVTVDGRQTGVAEGVTLPELADFLIAQFSAIEAVNLDGGGSTTLVMDHSGTRVMNAPVGVGSGQPAINTERSNGANLAIFATRRYGIDPSRTLLAYEGFDYAVRAWGTDANTRPTSGSVNSLSGGSGWASPWNDTGSRWAGIAIDGVNLNVGDARADALTYTSPANEALPTAGGQYRGAFGTGSTSTRQIDLSLIPLALLRPGAPFPNQLGADGTTLWLSFLAQSAAGAGTTGTTQRFAYVQLGGAVRFGKLENSPTGNWGAIDAAGGGAPSFSPVSSGTEAMYLVKVEFQPGPEQVSVWLNPASLTNESMLGVPTLAFPAADFGFSELSIIGRYSTDFDELRLGTTFASVTIPPVPPACPGDANADGTAGLSDIAAVILVWGQTIPPAPGTADLDGSGEIGLGDIAQIIIHWAEACL